MISLSRKRFRSSVTRLTLVTRMRALNRNKYRSRDRPRLSVTVHHSCECENIKINKNGDELKLELTKMNDRSLSWIEIVATANPQNKTEGKQGEDSNSFFSFFFERRN